MKTQIRYWLTVFILLIPSAILFKLGGGIYSIPFIILVLMFVSLNNFDIPLRKNYKSILTFIPIIALFLLLLTQKHTIYPIQETITPSELDAAIIISCVTIFVAIASTLLVLKRTKGITSLTHQNMFYKIVGFIIALVVCTTYITRDTVSIFIITINGLVLGTTILLSHKEYLR